VNPVLDLPLNEGTGTTVYDRSGYDFHGTIYGATWQKKWRDWLLKLDGVDDYVEVLDAPELSPPQLTVEVWFYAERMPLATFQGIISKWDWAGARREYVLGLWEDKIRWDLYDEETEARTIIESTAKTINTWYHVVGTWDGSNMELWVDGVKEATGTFTAKIRDTTAPLMLARIVDGEFLKGCVASARIYKRALTADQIALLATLFRGEKRAPP